MSSLADLPEVIGFFSYSREDDESYKGRLSGLREAIQHELAAQLGRSKATFRLWQDKEAIAPGKLWEEEIKAAVGQSVFFIPIVTPRAINSNYCKFEFEAFLARERALGRADLVFPILYVPVPALEEEARWRDHPVLSVIGKRQYVDWQTFRYSDVHTPAMREEIARFARTIVKALHQTWLTPDERRRQEEAQAQARAEEEHRRQEAEAKRRAEEEARRKEAEEERLRRETEAEQRRKEAAEAERQRRETETKRGAEEEEQQRAEAERQKAESEQLRREAEARRRSEAEERRIVEAKRRAEAEEQRRLRRSQAPPLWRPSRPAVVAASLIGVVALGAIGAWYALSPTPAPRSAAQERALKPGDTFQECTNCPVMMVVPAGSFTMGTPASVLGHYDWETPQHRVTIAQQFAVGRFEVTFDEWDACVAGGGCNDYAPPDEGWGRGRRPVINMSWNDIKAYVGWLAQETGKPYRLLSEAKYEYATRAGTTTPYPWGNAIGKNNANCNGCGSEWDNKETAPVGSFPANGFGLYDMVGNVEEWTEDCWHERCYGAPTDGSAWTSGDCKTRVVRGGGWKIYWGNDFSADRGGEHPDLRSNEGGFRVARTLLAR